MSTDMTIFKNNPALALLEGVVDDITSTLAGSGGGFSNRISVRGGRFREVVNGKEVRVSKEESLDVVVVAAAHMARTYYDGVYVEGEGSAPMCWSSDTNVPSPEVPADQRQSDKCMDCPQNVKGSGQGETRACRFSQRVAVVLDGLIEEGPVYQMQLPATTLFGDDKDKMSLQGYARLLKAHNTNIISIVTRLTMDTDSTTPKLSFSPVRPLSTDELSAALEHKTSDAAHAAITMTVAQVDKVPTKTAKELPMAAPAPAAKKKPFGDANDAAPSAAKETSTRKAKPKPEAEPAPKKGWEVVDEPTKRAAKKPEPAVAATDVSSMLDEWDDE